MLSRPVLAKLSSSLAAQLAAVDPSRDEVGFEYRPCDLMTDHGLEECVYVADVLDYERFWGPDYEERKFVSVTDVRAIASSQARLAPQLATAAYSVGEMGMGRRVVVLECDQGRSFVLDDGDAIDFPALPDGVSTTDVVTVRAFRQSDDPIPRVGVRDYKWCLYER